jgi:octaprenyl-diphosphate synthase
MSLPSPTPLFAPEAQTGSEATDLSPLLRPLLQLFSEEMVQVDQILCQALSHPTDLIPQVGGHLISSGGKRLRPMLLLATARLCHYTGQEHLKLASCLECIHNATLLHDDVMDQSLLRRGKPTAHRIWGTPASIVVGDFLLCRALEWMTEIQSWPIVRLVNAMATKIIEGQALDLALSAQLDVAEHTYFDVIHLKTAWLFQTACELGALLAHHPHQDNLRRFGYHAGMAFQLVDDILDYTSTPEILGKNPGQDFQEGKITLPIIRALAMGTVEERGFWKRTLQQKKQSPEDFETAKKILRAHKVFESVGADAQTHLVAAQHALHVFPSCAIKDALADMLSFICNQLS